MIATPTFPDLAALVVDESLYVRRILRDMLTRVGIRRLIEAHDGAEALGSLAENKPDLVILDWDLAILSGEEFIRLTRTPATSPAPTIPIMLMLSKPRRPIVERAVALGVNAIIAKPFSPKTLWSRLDELINRPRPLTQINGLMRPAPRDPIAPAPRTPDGPATRSEASTLGSKPNPLLEFVPTNQAPTSPVAAVQDFGLAGQRR